MSGNAGLAMTVHSLSQNVETQSGYEKSGGLDTVDVAAPGNSSEIRRHLRWWQGQQDNEPTVVQLEKLPGFDISGNVQNSVSQSGENDPYAISAADDADLVDESEPVLDAEGQIDDVALDRKLLKSGDMVNLSFQQTQLAAIVIRSFEEIAQVYTVHGEVLHVTPRAAAFRVEGMVSPNELAPLMPHLPKEMVMERHAKKTPENQTAVPRDIGAPLINKMLHFTGLADESYRKYAYRIDHAWEIMMPSKSPHVFTLEEIATKIFRKPNMSTITNPMLWAMYRVMMRDERVSLDLRSHRIAPRFWLESQKKRDSRLMVMKWIRDYQEYQASDTTASFNEELDLQEDSPKPTILYAFIHKAQAFIRKSREVRDIDATGRLGLSKVRHAEVKFLQPPGLELAPPFNKNDEKILQCLCDWSLSGKALDKTGSANIGPAILRAIGMYDGLKLDRSIGLLLLKELGVITPWENPAIYFSEYPLPGHGIDPAFDELKKLANPPDLKLKDSMEGLRKDWADMPVFCIDSFDTVDVDDGVSWEAADERTSWVHVHVANPSAFIDKDSAIAQYAAKLSMTLYLVERRYWMLESDKVRKHCSLAPGCPSITFSARLDAYGDIMETRVTHGILRNIKYLTPETVGRYFSGEATSSEKCPAVTVGGEWRAETKRNDQTLADAELEILLKLREAGSARRKKRDPPLVPERGFPEPEVDLGKDHPPFGVVLDRSRRIEGDPLIALRVQPFDPLSRLPSNMVSDEFVADLMLIAGEVAAKWSAERGIPIAYAGTAGYPALKPERDAFEKNVIRPAMIKGDSIPRPVVNHYFALAGRTSSFPNPVEHRYLNLPAYCRATSPLRRFGDLFSHWQIDAAARYEAIKGVSLIGNTEDHFLPYSRAEAVDVLRDYDIANEHCNIIKRRTRQHWMVQWFDRAYYHHQAPLPKTFSVYIARVDIARGICYGTMKEIWFPCVLSESAASRAEGGFEEGDTWEVEIEKVDLYQSSIQVQGVRLLEKSTIKHYLNKV